MKICKIILFALLIIKSFILIAKAVLENDEEEQLKDLVKVLFTLPITWLLYWGAGLLDF